MMTTYSFSRDDLTTVRDIVRGAADDAGVAAAERDRLLVAVSELATNAVVHGGGCGDLTVRRFDDRIAVEICDSGPGLPDDRIPPRPDPTALGGRGLWLVGLLAPHCDIVNSAFGLTVRIWTPLDR